MNPVLHFLLALDFLDWWLFAIVLGITDVFVPRRWLVMPAIAAGLAGFVLLLFPQLIWPWQLAGFVVITAAGIGIRLVRGAQSRTTLPTTATIEEPSMPVFHDFNIKTIQGKEQSLGAYKGQTVLVVNVASECGLTPQYAGLEKLYREFKDRSFSVLGLPCNQFGHQEPGSETEIQKFCQTRYDVTFPLASKIEVNGTEAHPLYKWLKSATGGAEIQWNFEKFLIAKDGRIIKRYSPKTTPEDPQLRKDLQAAL